jgi:hypothetical protein
MPVLSFVWLWRDPWVQTTAAAATAEAATKTARAKQEREAAQLKHQGPLASASGGGGSSAIPADDVAVVNPMLQQGAGKGAGQRADAETGVRKKARAQAVNASVVSAAVTAVLAEPKEDPLLSVFFYDYKCVRTVACAANAVC